VDLERLGQMDCADLSEFERIVLGNPDRWDWPRVLREVEEDPSLARLRWHNDATLLHYAANDTQPALVNLLLRHGADVNARDKIDGAPLHSAAKGGHVGIVRTLLQYGASLGMRDSRGLTPLYWACINHNDKIVKLLLASGAAPEDDYSKKYVESLAAHGLL
jgi:ankyrin repeat protein